MSQTNRTLKLKNLFKILAIVNLIVFTVVFILEIIGMFIELPILVYSEGDASGLADFSGNYFDHILKALIAILFVIIFLTALHNMKSIESSKFKNGLSFMVGGIFLIVGIGCLFFLSWLATLFDLALVGELGEIVWYQYFRLEMIVAVINLPTLLSWKEKISYLEMSANE